MGRKFLLLNEPASIYSPRGSGQFGLSAPSITNSSHSSGINIGNLSISIDGSQNAVDVANQVVERIKSASKINNIRTLQKL